MKIMMIALISSLFLILMPREDEMKPMDPVAENMALITAEPVKAHLYQDHESHIRVHMSALQDPKIQEIMKDAPNAQAVAAAGAAHIQEHVAFQYRREIEKQLGVPMPEFDKERLKTQSNKTILYFSYRKWTLKLNKRKSNVKVWQIS